MLPEFRALTLFTIGFSRPYTHMPEPTKETVIIVHGTWAAPTWAAPEPDEPPKRRWYEPVDGRPGGEPFPAKLDAALQERGSRARCWAHCAQGNQIFHWSGDNNWIARTHAASGLGDYVAQLQKEGWRCHIVAHSHGGNVVVESLPLIMAAPSYDAPLGKIVALGAPFMDTVSPIQKRVKRNAEILNILSSIALATLLAFLFTLLIISMLSFDEMIRDSAPKLGGLFEEYILDWRFDLLITFTCLFALIFALSFRLRPRPFPGYIPKFIPAPFRSFLLRCLAIAPAERVLERWPQCDLLAISSPKDEAWQLLYHIPNISNPLAINLGFFSYVFLSLRSLIVQSAAVARIHGARSFRNLGIFGKFYMTILHFIVHVTALSLVSVLLVYLGAPIELKVYLDGAPIESNKELASLYIIFLMALFLGLLVLSVTKFFGPTFYSAFLSPYRRYARVASALASLPSIIATYIVHRRGWSVMLAIAMGVEGYPYQIPFVDRHLSYAPTNFVKYEDVPKCTEQRALDRRSAWVRQHLENVSDTFSKLVVTSADLSLLLRRIEEDQSLVHAAYCTDDECIARIADWIAGKG
jgi:hypothetical protein